MLKEKDTPLEATMSSFLPLTSYNFAETGAAAAGQGIVGNEVTFPRDPTTTDVSGPAGAGYQLGQLWYSTASSTLWILQSISGGSATWSASTAALTSPLTVPNGGTGLTTLTNHSVLVGAGTSAITPLTVGSNGQVLVGSTGANPVFATLTSSDGSIVFTAGAGTLSLQAAPNSDFASPGPIGSVAPNTGAFTTLSSTSTTTLASGSGAVSTIGSVAGASGIALNIGTGNLLLTGAAGSTVTLGTGITTGSFTVGAALTTGTITIGGTAETGALTLGSSSGAQSVLIANGAGASTVAIANVQTAGSLAVGTGMTTGTISIGGTAMTGTLTIGTSSGTNTLVIGGGSGATAVQIANAQVAGSVAIGAAMTTGTIALGGAQTTGTIIIGGGVQTGALTFGGGTGAQTVNLATGGTGIKTVNIGNTAGVANVLSIGTLLGTTTFNGPSLITLASGTATGLAISTSGGTGVGETITTSASTVDALQLTGGGIKTAVTVVTAGASPLVANNRFFSTTFSGVSIAAGASQTFVVTNSTVTGSATVIKATMYGATAGTALSIVSITPSAGSISIVVTNGAAVTTNTANITFVGWVMN